MFSVVVTESADKDLTEILEYITGVLSNPKAATDFLDRVDECYSNLENNPLMFERCHDTHLEAQGYRRAVIKNYIMVYRVEEKENKVIVLNFFYGRRDYEKLI